MGRAMQRRGKEGNRSKAMGTREWRPQRGLRMKWRSADSSVMERKLEAGSVGEWKGSAGQEEGGTTMSSDGDR